MTRKTNPAKAPVPALQIERHILLIRGEKVMLDADLAVLYEVETKVLLQAVRRNLERFPGDFMFQLNKREFERLRSQIVTSNIADWQGDSGDSDPLRSQNVTSNRGGRRQPPYAFTEQGVAMLSSILRSKRAVQVNVEIMRAFVRLRQMLETNKDLAQKLDALEQKYDDQFSIIFDAIRELMTPAAPQKKRPIGFIRHEESPKK